MSRITFQIPFPTFIESIVVYFLLRCRKKRYGCAFRRIKLITDKDVDVKHRYTIVDPEDYQKLAGYNWQLFENNTDKYYAIRAESKKIVYMHRVIINAPAGKIVDHENRNGLDNRKTNLRLATKAENSQNGTKKVKNTSSKYKGVCLNKRRGKWMASITYNRKRRFLGYFDNEADAARAYDEAAKKYHGEFAVLNFDDGANHESANLTLG